MPSMSTRADERRAARADRRGASCAAVAEGSGRSSSVRVPPPLAPGGSGPYRASAIASVSVRAGIREHALRGVPELASASRRARAPRPGRRGRRRARPARLPQAGGDLPSRSRRAPPGALRADDAQRQRDGSAERCDEPPRDGPQRRRQRPRPRVSRRAGARLLRREVEEPARPERPHGVGRVGRERVHGRERPAARRRVEREPPVAGEPGLDPGVRLLVGHGPDARLPGPRGEPDGDARRNAERPQHQRHRARVVLAVSRPRHLDEVDERIGSTRSRAGAPRTGNRRAIGTSARGRASPRTASAPSR